MKGHILLGAPGCGKGTAARLLVERLALIHLSTGDILRDAVSKGTDVGLRAKAIMASGKLVDDDTVNGLVFARLQGETGSVLFDGYPRTLQQAQSLEAFLSSKGQSLGLVVNLEVPREVLEARIVGRRTCSNYDCAAIYHLETRPPLVEGVCDRCGSKLKRRADDTAEAFRSRMLEFDATFQPMLAHFKGRPNYRSVDGNRSAEAVFESLVQLFGESA